MHTLHRHIFTGVLLACAAAAGLFAFVLVVGNALKDLLGYALAGQLPPEALGRMLLLLVPYVLAYALPMGVLTGVLLVLGRMSAQQEITAVRAAGLGLGYVARPVALLGALLALLALAVNFEYMPRARAAYREALADMVRKNPLRFIVPKTFIRDFPGVVYYIGEKDDAGGIKDVWVWRLDKEQRTTEFIHAREGQVVYDAQANTLQLTLLGQPLLDRRNPLDPEKFSNSDYLASSKTAPFPAWNLDTLFGPQKVFQMKPAWMTFAQLQDEAHRLAALPVPADPVAARQQAHDRIDVAVSLQEKGTNALTVLVFALLAVPLGVRVSRRETSANLAVALALAMVYLLLGESIHWLEKYPALRPDLLLWVPPALFLLLAAWLFRRVARV